MMMLDGNVFLTTDSYLKSLRGIHHAEDQHLLFMLSPFYRVTLEGTTPKEIVRSLRPNTTLESVKPSWVVEVVGHTQVGSWDF